VRTHASPPDASKGFGVEPRRFSAEGDQTFNVSERWAFLTQLRLEHLRWQQQMLRLSGKDGPYGKPPKESVVPLCRRLPAPLEIYFALQ